jgi:hypothetical protein
MRSVWLPQRPHPLAGTTLPGMAGWRGRCPALDADHHLPPLTGEINKRPLQVVGGHSRHAVFLPVESNLILTSLRYFQGAKTLQRVKS